jgi:hypothetical protein
MAHRPTRSGRWVDSQKGQVLIIFALTAVVLFAIMGLAVDAGISYLHSDQQEKAAEAAALSGVSYLPGDYPDAKSDALLTAQRDGYTPGGSGSTAVTVTAVQPTGTTNQLEVAITAPAPVYFLELLGFGEHEVTSFATAEYLPPIQLGQPGNSLGTTLASSGGDLGSGGYYFLRTEGWGNPRSEGDPFTPTPNDGNSTGCGPTGTSCVAATPDVHQISCIAGDDLCDNDSAASTDCGTADNLCLNDTGGENYLIYVPAGTTADVQVYNPSFDPGDDTDCGSQTPTCLNTFHEDDGSFPTLTDITDSNAPATDFDSMAYTLFAVPEINNRAADIPLEQDIFCPFNAYDLDTGGADQYSYYEEGSSATAGPACNPTDIGSGTATLKTVSATPAVYNAPPAGEAADGNSYTPKAAVGAAGITDGYVSLSSYAPTGANANLFAQTYNTLASESAYTADVGGAYYLSGGSGTGGQYFRLRVDTLAWNGAVINTSSTSPSVSSDPNGASLPDQYPLGHNAYALQVVTPSGGTGDCALTTPATDTCTISAMADMTIYTPIDGTNPLNADGSFFVPLFNLPEEYAGQQVVVRAFDPGDVGGGSAYIGILQPAGVAGAGSPLEYATLATSGGQPDVDDIGTSLSGGTNTPITPNDGTNPADYPSTADSAIVQTAASDGGAIYNGNWVQFTIQVPSDYAPGTSGAYWDLYYQVASAAYAGDTLAFQVQYQGSPVHLLSPTS